MGNWERLNMKSALPRISLSVFIVFLNVGVGHFFLQVGQFFSSHPVVWESGVSRRVVPEPGYLTFKESARGRKKLPNLPHHSLQHNVCHHSFQRPRRFNSQCHRMLLMLKCLVRLVWIYLSFFALKTRRVLLSNQGTVSPHRGTWQ